MKNTQKVNLVKVFGAIMAIAMLFAPLAVIRADEDESNDDTSNPEVVVETNTDATNTPVIDPIISNGSIDFHKYQCPTGTTIADENGPDSTGAFVLKEGCLPEAGIIFGYIHEDKTDLTSPYPGLNDNTMFTTLGTTDASGYLLVSGLPATGRYDVAEISADGSLNASAQTIRLLCTGDSINNDNYETTFVPANGTAHCVAYNSGLVVSTTTDNGGGNDGGNGGNNGTSTDTTATSTPDTSSTGSSVATSGPSGMGGGSDGSSVDSSTGAGQVLGAEIGPDSACGIWIKSYIKIGAKNDVEDVYRLQIFLNKHEKAGLSFTGTYDAATVAAVNAFQLKYNDQVLKPWSDIGLLPSATTTTSYVYKTTKREINNLNCPSLNLPMPMLP